MASGQVIGRHEVFEYTYKLGPVEDRKRIKLVVIQRRDQRRKSLIAAQKYLDHTPVRLRVNLHQAKFGVPEVTSGSRQIPITLRRKAKSATTRTTTRIVRAPAPPPQARAAHGLLTPPHTAPPPPSAPPPPEPARIELVDNPVPRADSASPGVLIADPHPIVVVPGSTSSSDRGHDVPPPIPPSPSGSSISFNRPIVKRSNSFGSSFRRFPSLMGLIRRNSKSTTPPTQTDPIYDTPRSEELEHAIIEERESELGSPVGAPSGYGPPSVTGSRVSRKPVPPIPESSPPTSVANSGRSRTFSFGRRPSVSGSPRNRLVKASPRNVPLPDSVRDPSVRDQSVLGSPQVLGAFPHSVTAGSHDGRSVRSRRTERSIQQQHTPEYVHDEYLHDSPTAASRSLRGPSIGHRDGSQVSGRSGHYGREPSITQLSMRDGSVINGDRSLHGGSLHDRSMHGGSVHDRSMHGGSVHERSIHAGSTHDRSIHDKSMYGGSDHRSSGGRSLHNRSVHDLPSDGYRSPSIPDAVVRDAAFSDGDRENDHGAWSPRSGSVSDVHRGMSPELHRGLSPDMHRGMSPSLHAPSSHRGPSPSLHGHSQRGSPSLHAPSHAPSRGASPSLHAPSQRALSPDAYSRTSHRDHSREPSPSLHRGASPSLHAPSHNGTNGNGITYSPPASMHAPSAKSRGASSVASSKIPMSSISRQLGSRPKSPLSASGSSNTSSRKTNRPPGPEIMPVPMSEGPRSTAPSLHAPSTASHKTGGSRSLGRSPLARGQEAPALPPKAPSVGSQLSGRASEARTNRSSGRRRP
ncbi:Smr domain protein [Ceratobasidium sp. AG-Ba]|nr:Smr domain protein [Ceratobasidium sp. AG-Ba]